MRIPVLAHNTRKLARGAAIAAIAAVAAGCSSDVMRFQDLGLGGGDRSGALQPVSQPAPGGYGAQAGLDPTYTGSVNGQATRRSEQLGQPRRPLPRGELRGPAGAVDQPFPAAQPFPTTQAPSQPFPGPSQSTVMRQPMPQASSQGALPPVGGGALDRTVTGTTPAASQPRESVADARPGGWSKAGGTQITVRQGETVYNLSRRFGVPADSILRANGMGDAGQLQAGQQIVIPTYVYSRNAPVSAPDSDRNVANSGASPQRTPPLPAPTEQQAVLPQPPRQDTRQAPAPQPNGSTTPASGSASASVYTVVAGDTLSAIARRHGTSAEAIRQANGLDTGLIRIGQKLTLPGAGASSSQAAATARPADPVTTASTPQAPAQPPAAQAPKPGEAENVIREAALDSRAAPDGTGIAQLRWPVRGRVVSAFGNSAGGKSNDGIDIAVPKGTPVRAAENGLVIYAGDGLKEFGNTVLVRHENGIVTVYGHASQIKVSRGDTVRRGQEIALSGISGNAESPRLHFEVRKDSVPVNPTTYLE